MNRRATRMLTRVIAIAPCLATGTFCADRNTQRAVNYFPLEVGARWIYQVLRNGGARGQVSVKVTDRTDSPDGTTYSLTYEDSSLPRDEQDDEPIEYSVRREGVYCEKCPGFVLRDPLVVGREWQSGGDSTRPEVSKVIAVTETVTVGQTRYDNCVVVRASDLQARQHVVTTYAPNVGPVVVEYENNRGVVERREELQRFQRASAKATGEPGH